jgi:hypothetical protein
LDWDNLTQEMDQYDIEIDIQALMLEHGKQKINKLLEGKLRKL